MENGKEKRIKETANRDPLWDDKASVDVSNRLTLPSELKTYLAEQGMDYRFLNAAQFREAGNYHHSDWRPFNVNQAKSLKNAPGATPEGLIQRGDLILGIRPKTLSAKHKEALARRNKAYSQVNHAKSQKKMLQDQIRDRGLSEVVSVDDREDGDEGYA